VNVELPSKTQPSGEVTAPVPVLSPPRTWAASTIPSCAGFAHDDRVTSMDAGYGSRTEAAY